MFNEEAFVMIRGTWQADQEHPARNRRKLPIPSVRLLRELVEPVFVASLRTEEGRELSFSLIVVPRDEEQRRSHLHGTCQEVVPFSDTVPLSSESLCKLAPACDSRIGALMVDVCNEETGACCIWGVMFYGPPLRALTEVPVHIGELSTQRPDILTITVDAPGSLTVSRGISQIGRFLFGAFSPAQPSPFAHRALGQYLAEYIDGWKLREGCKEESQKLGFYRGYLSALEHLLDEIRDRGHGGTLSLIHI